MNYQESLDFIYGQLPSYQLLGSGAYKENLNNINALLNVLDRPEKKIKFVHIAGTNGKGTSAHAIAAVLQASNYKVGLYTSPLPLGGGIPSPYALPWGLGGRSAGCNRSGLQFLLGS